MDAEGRFQIDGLEPGLYRASVVFSDTFPIVGSPLLAVGNDSRPRLVVSARIIDIHAVDETGERVTLDWIRRADLVEDRGDSQSGPGATTVRLAPPSTEHSITVPVRGAYLVSAGGVDGMEYTGLLADGMSPGRHSVRLERRPAAFGAVTLAVESAALPPEAHLVQFRAEQTRLSVHLKGAEVRESNERVVLHYPALLPGSYTFQVDLADAGAIGLRQKILSVEVDAGVEQEVLVPSFIGGLVDVEVSTTLPLAERTLAQLEVRRAGEAEWHERSFHTDETANGGGVFTNGSALVNGPPARSFPWDPGDYEVRVQLTGHAAASKRFRLLEGQTERVQLELLLDGK